MDELSKKEKSSLELKFLIRRFLLGILLITLILGAGVTLKTCLIDEIGKRVDLVLQTRVMYETQFVIEGTVYEDSSVFMISMDQFHGDKMVSNELLDTVLLTDNLGNTYIPKNLSVSAQSEHQFNGKLSFDPVPSEAKSIVLTFYGIQDVAFSWSLENGELKEIKGDDL